MRRAEVLEGDILPALLQSFLTSVKMLLGAEAGIHRTLPCPADGVLRSRVAPFKGKRRAVISERQLRTEMADAARVTTDVRRRRVGAGISDP
jgi:hypothetical protein